MSNGREFKSAEDAAKKIWERIRERMKTGRYSHVLIAGFADVDGTPITNVSVSKRRARNLKTAMEEAAKHVTFQGVRPPLVDIGRGEEPNARFFSSGEYDGGLWSRRAEVRLCSLAE